MNGFLPLMRSFHIGDISRRYATTSGTTFRMWSISSSVLYSLRDSRREPWATSCTRPMASSTWLGSRLPEVQAAGHVKIDVNAMHIDLLSLSAHKFHGPKGVGMLYARRGIILTNLIEGGAQERGKRGGTENVPGIAAMAAALTEACANMDENTKKVTALRDKLVDGISKIPHCALNGDPVNRLPGNVSFCFEGIEGESLLLLLDAKGISASSGSACTSGSLDPSHVLLAIGRPHEVAHGSLRLTICEDNTEEEIDYILAELPPIVDDLRNMSPVWKDLMSGKRQFTL